MIFKGPSPDGYRKMMWSLSHAAEKAAEEGNAKVLATATRALNGITRAAAVDKQLEDLATLHSKIKQLQQTIEALNATKADQRHQQAARIDDADNASATAVDGEWSRGSGIGSPPIH